MGTSKKTAERVLGGPTTKARTATQSAQKPDKPKRAVKVERKTIDCSGMSFDKDIKIPKNVAEAVDLWFAVRAYRLDEQKKVDAIKAQESRLRQYLIDNIPKSLATGVAGQLVRVQIVQKESLAIEDEEAFMRFAHRKGNEDLLIERPNMRAVEERLENGKKVPGLTTRKYADISYSKL